MKIESLFFTLFIMDRYKQRLCFRHFGGGEGDILRCIIENKQGRDYEYHLNADGKLHSRYLEEFGCYEPAIIRREQYVIWLYWLFDGEIKDCLHPFMVIADKKTNDICAVEYYSLDRIQQQQPIYLSSCSDSAVYNKCDDNIIIVDPNIPSCIVYESQFSRDKIDISQFVTVASDVVCPRWPDEFANGDDGLLKFKFED